jgi:signal transduction histidine kinase
VQTGRRPDGVTVEAVLDLRADHAARSRLATAMLVSGGLGLLLAAAAGAWLGRRATRPLSAALTLQRRFVSDASHELRTPLTLLSTRAQLLRRRLEGAEDPGVRDAAHRVVDDAARLAAILDDLLMAARPPDAREHVPVDLVALAAEVAADAQAGSASVTVNGPPARHDPRQCTVLGSPVALRRAVTGLVDNATRHARQAVRISVRRADHRVLLEVADDGPGVDPGLAPRLFHRFVSAHPPDADGRRHYGLGLALVSEIATGHGGAVELIDSPCPGAVFRISLPAR